MSTKEAIHNWMVAHKKTLALAESCTGGFMAAQLTALPGASNYFLGSMVVYSNALKEKVLGLSCKTVEAQGVVSEEAVQGMLQGLFRLTEADYGIAVSGIAGPGGGTEKKPVGTICYALGPKKGAPQVGTLHLQGNRETIILLTSKKLLDLLWQLINNK
jgi:PncC family amidohydrolase